MAGQIHQFDIGTEFIFEFRDQDAILPLDDATLIEVIFRKPGAPNVTKEPTLVTDGSDGLARYIALENDLDVTGKWRAQGHVIKPSGEWHSTEAEFTVYPNLD